MGRFLAVAIPTKILLENRKGMMVIPNKIDVNKDKEAILEKISKYIDLSFYKTYIKEPEVIEKPQDKEEKNTLIMIKKKIMATMMATYIYN